MLTELQTLCTPSVYLVVLLLLSPNSLHSLCLPGYASAPFASLPSPIRLPTSPKSMYPLQQTDHRHSKKPHNFKKHSASRSLALLHLPNLIAHPLDFAFVRIEQQLQIARELLSQLLHASPLPHPLLLFTPLPDATVKQL